MPARLRPALLLPASRRQHLAIIGEGAEILRLNPESGLHRPERFRMAALLPAQHAQKLQRRRVGRLPLQYLLIKPRRLIQLALAMQIKRALDRRRGHGSALQPESINMGVMRD